MRANEASLPSLEQIAPTEKAPFRDISRVTKEDELYYVQHLSLYLKDPFQTAYRDGLEGYGNADDEAYLTRKCLDALDGAARDGQTYFARQLAGGIASSPLATLFDDRQEFEEAKANGWLMDEMGLLVLVPSPEVIWAETYSYARNLLSAKHESGIELGDDEIFNDYVERQNVGAAQYRALQLAYRMDDKTFTTLEKGHRFMMRMYGKMARPSDGTFNGQAIYHKFVNQEPVDYREIPSSMTYVPVKMSPHVVGFYEGTGRLVEMFDLRNKPQLREGVGESEVQYYDRALQRATNSEARADWQAEKDELYADPPLAAADIVGGCLQNVDGAQKSRVTGAFFGLEFDLQTRAVMERALGIDLADYEMEDQVLLAQLLTTCSERQMAAVQALVEYNGSPHGLIEVARAIEFGADFGEAIIGIVEMTEPAESQQIMQLVTGYRQEAKQFAGWFSEIDPVFSRSVEDSFNERLSELLVAGLAVAKDGRLDESILRDNQRIKLKNMQEYINVLRVFGESFSSMVETVEQGTVQKVTADSAQSFSVYRFMPVSKTGKQVTVYIRPEGAYDFDGDMEYGRPGEGVEASISFVINPEPGRTYIGARKSEKPQDLSIRFDREGVPERGLRADEARDPTVADGTISLDIGSILGRDDNLGTIIGRTIGAGNKLRAAKQGRTVAFNHTKNHFDQALYGSDKGFAVLAERVKAMMEARVAAGRRRKVGQLSVQAADSTDQTLAA